MKYTILAISLLTSSSVFADNMEAELARCEGHAFIGQDIMSLHNLGISKTKICEAHKDSPDKEVLDGYVDLAFKPSTLKDADYFSNAVKVICLMNIKAFTK